MRSEHIVDGWWELSGKPVPELDWPGTKNAQSHRVWISAPARDIIAATRAEGFVFAGSRGGAINDIDVTMREICKKLGSSALHLTICVERTARSSRRSVSDAKP